MDQSQKEVIVKKIINIDKMIVKVKWKCRRYCHFTDGTNPQAAVLDVLSFVAITA